MNWVADDVLPPFKNLPDPILTFGMTRDLRNPTSWELSGGTAANEMAAEQAAQGYLLALSGYLVEAYNAIPAAIAGSGYAGGPHGT